MAYLPTAHAVHVEDPSELTFPDAHAEHTVVLELYLPEGQLSHCTAPVDGAIAPLAHVVHEDFPVEP